ncbi:MAG: DUF5723 family protein [Bacteroidia bacterium]|nr:DUF5723 family protein [Bacteroidia bacterium]
MMELKKYFLIYLYSVISFAQEFHGFMQSHYSGIYGAAFNPAHLADNRQKWGIGFTGLNFHLENNYIFIRKEKMPSIPQAIRWAKTGNGPYNWDSTNKLSPNYYKYNYQIIDNDKPKSFYTTARLMMPSFFFTLNEKSSVGFQWSIRNYINIDGISRELGRLLYEEFIYPSIWFTRLTNRNLSIQQLTWAEYGITYARVLSKAGSKHFLKAGINPKLLQGLSAFYLYIENLYYQFNTSDTLLIFQSDVKYGHSENYEFDENNIKYKFISTPGIGFDIGVVYEWRPDIQNHLYSLDGKDNLERQDHNKYKLKLALSFLDLGSLRFKKGALSNDFFANTTNPWYIKDIEIKNVYQFDSLMTAKFGTRSNEKDFKMMLPTQAHLFLDYHVYKHFYAGIYGNVSNFFKTDHSAVRDFSRLSALFRFDHPWVGVSVPVLLYDGWANVRGMNPTAGFSLRAGPLALGVHDVTLLFMKKNFFGSGLFFALQIPVYHKKPKDKDGDGVSDPLDHCPKVKGIWAFYGCPDTDGDGIQDSEDECALEAGIKELKGCPDKDMDGITDKKDTCPDIKGFPEFYGCPDSDGDKIEDRKDECPDEFGTIEFKGCPDKDADGIPDKSDKCPDVFGPKEFEGCPDKDGDLLIDKEDACPEVFGPKENKGCPWPDIDKDGLPDKDDACPSIPGPKELKGCPPAPKLTEKEQKIIEKAFSNLEFATNKDIIKPKSFPSLNELAGILLAHKGEWKLKLSGHTDNVGDDQKNMILSEKRAKAVKKYLVKKGVPEQNIECEWFGETMPIADNNTEAGRQKNRRVEMKILYKE